MIRIVRLACGFSLAATVALPACSSGDGAAPSPSNTASAFSSGLPQGQSYASVTDADIGALCKAWANYVIGPQRDTFCKTRAWGAATAAVSSFEAMGCGPTPGGCVGAWDSNGMAVGGPPPSGDVQCTEECSRATGPACSYECSGSTQTELEANCVAARETNCGMTDADLQAACAAAQTKCEAPIPFDDVVVHCDFQKPAAGCTATVGEFEACVAEYFVITEDSYSGFSACSSLTVADVKQLVGGPPTVVSPGNYTACKTFNDKCPGAFAGSGVSPDCGNGVLDPGEQCDGTNLDGETCASVTGGSLPNGELVCNPACLFDGSVCSGP